MELVLVRHAIAEERREDLADAERALTDRGARRFRRAVSGLAALELTLDGVLHSPWRRAAQTAALLAPLTDGPMWSTEKLARIPGSALLEELGALPGDERTAVVGHEPWMSELCALLVVGDPRHAESMPFKKGGVAVLEGLPMPGRMELRAMWPPRSLRQIGKLAR